MYCPECGVEYRAGFTECADCHVGLVEQLPAPAEAPSGSEQRTRATCHRPGAICASDLAARIQPAAPSARKKRTILDRLMAERHPRVYGGGARIAIGGAGRRISPANGSTPGLEGKSR